MFTCWFSRRQRMYLVINCLHSPVDGNKNITKLIFSVNCLVSIINSIIVLDPNTIVFKKMFNLSRQLYCLCVEKFAFCLIIYIKTFNTINNKTSTTQWNTELKTTQIQGKYLTITLYNNVHTHTHAHNVIIKQNKCTFPVKTPFSSNSTDRSRWYSIKW